MLLVPGTRELEGRAPLPDGREHAVAAARARELVHRRVVVAPGLEPGEVADVDDRRVVVRRPGLREALQRHGRLGDAALVGGARAAERRARLARRGPPGESSPKVRVIQIEPSFFGKPCSQPRVSAKSRSTQMKGQVVTSSPSRRALTTTKHSLYCEREGSSSSPPASEHDCQSAKTSAQRPGSSVGLDLLEAPRRPSRGRPSTRSRGSRRRSATADRGRATTRPARRARDRVARQRLMRRAPRAAARAPRVSRLSRSYSIATGSKRKYERGGSGPHVLDE